MPRMPAFYHQVGHGYAALRPPDARIAASMNAVLAASSMSALAPGHTNLKAAPSSPVNHPRLCSHNVPETPRPAFADQPKRFQLRMRGKVQ